MRHIQTALVRQGVQRGLTGHRGKQFCRPLPPQIKQILVQGMKDVMGDRPVQFSALPVSLGSASYEGLFIEQKPYLSLALTHFGPIAPSQLTVSLANLYERTVYSLTFTEVAPLSWSKSWKEEGSTQGALAYFPKGFATVSETIDAYDYDQLD